MKLYMFRHAKSSRDDSPEDSHDSSITDEGRDRHRLASKGMVAEGLTYTHAWVSQLKRSRQTYDIMARVFGSNVQARKLAALQPSANIDSLLEEIDALYAQDPNAELLVIGHNPQVSELLGLLGGAGTPHMGTSDMAYIEWGEFGPSVKRFYERESLVALGRNA